MTDDASVPPPPEQPPPPPPGAPYPPQSGAGAPPPGYPTAPGYPPPPGYPAYPNPELDPFAKSKLIAGLLGIFVGGLGIHRFYLGYTTIGVIQIVVTILTCGVGAIWGFIEGILYLVGTNGYTTDSTGRPLKS